MVTHTVTQAVIPLLEPHPLKWCHGVTSGRVFDCVATHPCLLGWHVSRQEDRVVFPIHTEWRKTLKRPLFHHALWPWHNTRFIWRARRQTWHTHNCVHMYLPIISKYTIWMHGLIYTLQMSLSNIYPSHTHVLNRLINTPWIYLSLRCPNLAVSCWLLSHDISISF